MNGEVLTIGIPTLRRLEYLREAVASALDQGAARTQVVISQDRLADGSFDQRIAAWARDLASRERKRVKYVLAERPLGLAGNWNSILENADGSFVTVIGDDDRLLPGFAEAVIGVASQIGGIVFSNHHVIDSAGQRLGDETSRWMERFHRAKLNSGVQPDPEVLAWQNAIPMSAAATEVALARKLRFDEDLNTPESVFFIRAAQSGARFSFVEDFLAEYRIHNGAATAGGLWIEKLARQLITLSASEPAEAAKRECLAAMLPVAVNRALLKGDTDLARSFLESSYYPCASGFGLAEAIRRFCAWLPQNTGVLLYRSVHKASRLRR